MLPTNPLKRAAQALRRAHKRLAPASTNDVEWRHDSVVAHFAELKLHIDGIMKVARAANQSPAAQQEILEALRLLEPHRAIGFDKVRVGSSRDGGYVQIDDPAGIVHALSFGISDNDSWDLAMAGKGVPVDQFDFSVDAAPSTHPLLKFHKLRISAERGEGLATLPDLVALHSRGPGPDIILKMDIEGAEWDVLAECDAASLGRIAQILCEFHDLSRLVEPEFRGRVVKGLRNLAAQFAAVHVHGNNCADMYVVENVPIPDVIEMAFVNRARYAVEPSFEIFPTPLDTPNVIERPDIVLGAFRF